MSRKDDFRRDVTRTQAPEGEVTSHVTSRTSYALPPRGLFESGAALGRYRIVALLGSGGLGDVYRAHDTRLERDVALKVLRSRGIGDKSAYRVLREARAAATLDHPNAVRVFDVGEIDGLPFLAMELIDGKPLRAFIADETIATDVRLSWLVQIASALGAAHGNGIVHRDVKPDNVMVRSDGVVKVVDFGIAHIGDSEKRTITISRAGIAIGTPAYMAPEQLRGEAVDGRTDQFAWGVLAFELIEGMRPWHSENSAESVARILSADVPELKNASVEIASIVRRCLAKDPGDRFESMGEVVSMLSAPARAGAKSVRRSRWAEYRLTVVGLVALALFGVLDRTKELPAPRHPGSQLVTTPAPPNSTAMALFDSAMIDFREGSVQEAEIGFEKAAANDPDLGRAHLWAAMLSQEPNANMRQHFQRAGQLRAGLSVSELGLLHCAEPWRADPSDWTASASCFESISEGIAEVPLFFEGWALMRKDDFEGATKALSRATAVDPQFGPAQYLLADVAMLHADIPAYDRALTKCAANAPASTGCLRHFIYRADSSGRCDEATERTLRMIALAPQNPWWFEVLANVQFALDGDIEKARTSLSHAAALRPSAVRKAIGLRDAVNLAVLAGDLESAELLGGKWNDQIASDANDWEHAMPFRVRTLIASEMGDAASAVRLAESYMRQQVAWTVDDFEVDTRIYPLMVRYRAGAITRSTFRTERAKWLEAERARARKSGSAEFAPFLWLVGYVQAVKDTTDARDVLEALPKYQPMFTFAERGVALEDWIARMYRLAGERDRARESLMLATKACEAVNFPMQQTWAFLDLASVLEEDGDVPGACRNYEKVLARWGREPRSVSARAAREGVNRLHCASRPSHQ